MRRLLPLLVLASCATTASAEQPLTVSEVWLRHHELNGKMIRVQGVVMECKPLACPLQESADDKWKWLGIGTSKIFDKAVVPYLGKPIVVEGRLRADCLHIMADSKQNIPNEHGDVVDIVCTDRASMIVNPQLIGLAP